MIVSERFRVLREEDSGEGGGDGGGGGNGTLMGGATPPDVNPSWPDWRKSMPEDLRNNKVFDTVKAKDTNEAFTEVSKQLANVQPLIGKKEMTPDDTWGDEQYEALYTKLGRPEKPEDYKVPENLEFTEGSIIDKESVNEFLPKLHAAGLTQRQIEKILPDFAEFMNGRVEQASKMVEKQNSEVVQELRSKHGDEGFNTMVSVAKGVVEKFGSDEMKVLIDSNPVIGSNPHVIEFLGTIGKEFLEDTNTSKSSGIINTSKEQAKIELDAKMQDSDFTKALLDENHANHSIAVQQRAALYKKIYG